MSETDNGGPWIEQPDGTRTLVQGSCSIGRLPSNQVVLAEERVSRRHALVNAQEEGEYWLVDLGSGNGTYLNGRRLVKPTLLRDGDQIEIGSFQLVFRQPGATAGTPLPFPADLDSGDKTIQHIKSSECWLLVADIEGSTQLIKKLTDDELPMMTGQWLEECKRIVEECGGSINKFLGDGFFAYWHHRDSAPAEVANTLTALKRLQEKANPCFRVVLHFGTVFMGGAASMGEESLLGKEVNFVFRLEKVAGSLGERCLMSEPAKNHLGAGLPTTAVGSHPVQSFEGEFPLFSF